MFLDSDNNAFGLLDQKITLRSQEIRTFLLKNKDVIALQDASQTDFTTQKKTRGATKQKVLKL